MDYKDLTAILVKTAGAIMFFWYLPWLLSLILNVINQSSSGIALFIYALPTIVGLAFAVLLFTFPSTISNKLISGEKLNHDATFVDSLQIVAMRLAGLYYVATSIFDLIHNFATVILTPTIYEKMGVTPPLTGWTPDLAAVTITTFVELAIGLWLILGAEGILRMIKVIRGRNS